VDYYKVVDGMKRNYPRTKDFPLAGLTAGPCLFKDTMQLANFYRNQFGLGFQAMLVNEGLPQFIVDRLATAYPLEAMTVGLLGMAFKAESDDGRLSLSYKLKKIIAVRAKAVLTTDPYVKNDPGLLPLDEVVRRSDVLILCAPHQVYRDLKLDHQIIVDIWNFWGRGSVFTRQKAAEVSP
jgi:UDP-N-acetyl-D-mannosaminuronic acid dehydrogenase